MNRLIPLVALLLIALPLSSCDKDEDYLDLPIEPNPELVEKGDEAGIKISKYMDQASGGVSVQGADCYGDFLFQFQHANAAVFIYDLNKKEFVSKVELKAKSQNHCNNVSFSRIFYEEGDEFPLLYVSGSQSGTYNQVQVYRIERLSQDFSIEQVQEIIFPQSSPDNNLYWTDVMIDQDSKYMYVSSAASDGGGKVSVFEVPEVSNDQKVLTDDDIIESFTVGKFTHHQGANIKDNIMFIFDGVPAWGDTNFLRIIDLGKKEDVAKINIMKKGFTVEAEGAFFYKGELFCATNNSGIFKVSMKDGISFN